MIFLVTGAHAVEVISDCESSSEAMEVFTEENGNQPILSVECISVTEAEDEMEFLALGGDG